MQLHNSIKLLLIIVCCMMCTSCWNATNIETQIYVSAMGVDFEDNEYTIYAQGQNFKSLIELNKREKDSSGAFVGFGKGASMYEASLNLARTAQTKVDWGHVEAIVVTERAFAHGGIAIPRRIYRFPETRYNSWFFITKDSIVDLFTTGNIYDDVSLKTLLLAPREVYKQEATVKPLMAFELVANLNEPDRTVAIPHLTINSEHWVNAGKNIPLHDISSAYFTSLNGKNYTFKLSDIKGFSHVQVPSRSLVSLTEDDEVIAELTIVANSRDTKVELERGEPKFKIKMKYKSAMYELHEQLSYEEIIPLLKKNIEDTIMETYLEAAKKEIDIYNLMHTLRREHPKLWRELTDDGRTFILTEDSLEVTIAIDVQFFGKYKLVPDSY